MFGILKVNNDISEYDKAKLREEWKNYQSGGSNSLFITSNEVEFIPITRGFKIIDKSQLSKLRMRQKFGAGFRFLKVGIRVNNEEGC